MKEIKHIAVPVDLQINTDKLLDYAVYVSNHFKAALYLIHVVPPFPVDSMLSAPFSMECQERMVAGASERIKNLIHDYSTKVPGIDGKVVVGDPSEKITELAAAKKVDLILISTHGTKGLERILLGSVAGRVLKRAHCPVLVINPFKQQFWQEVKP